MFSIRVPDRNGTARKHLRRNRASPPLDLVALRPFVAVCEERRVARDAASVSAPAEDQPDDVAAFIDAPGSAGVDRRARRPRGGERRSDRRGRGRIRMGRGRCPARHGRVDRGEPRPFGARRVRALEQVHVVADDRGQVVEVVRNAAGEPGEPLEPLRGALRAGAARTIAVRPAAADPAFGATVSSTWRFAVDGRARAVVRSHVDAGRGPRASGIFTVMCPRASAEGVKPLKDRGLSGLARALLTGDHQTG